ncbi:MAG: LytR C-terminal domain-containing protein [Candidatus Kapaibacterium sp.]|jgi:hypothetical protein
MKYASVVRLLVTVLLAAVVVAFGYALIVRFFIQPPVEVQVESVIGADSHARAIQLQILNATDVPGIAKKATDFLRRRGFDVVQVQNASFQTPKSFVVNVTADSAPAARVAYALGIDNGSVRREIDTTLVLDCTVVLGRDFNVLRPYR